MSCAAETWDVIVVGAGPAGSMAARQAALGGARVLLVEKSAMPREKVCGCCLSGAALAELAAAGLGDLPMRHGGQPLDALSLRCGGRTATIPLTRGVALSRGVLDHALARSAVETGVQLETQTTAHLSEPGHMSLRGPNGPRNATASVVISAVGLGGRINDASANIDSDSHMGAGVILSADAPGYRSGVIHMITGRGGYVGLVRLEHGRLDVAAAFDPQIVRRDGRPGAAAARILTEAGAPAIAELTTAKWHGTPALTRSATVAGPRLLVVGDAAGYVEPFTGEGMAWALASGRAAAAIALEAARADMWSAQYETRWAEHHRRLLADRMRRCQWVARALRHDRVMRGAVALLSVWPALARPLTRSLGTPLTLDMTPGGV